MLLRWLSLPFCGFNSGSEVVFGGGRCLFRAYTRQSAHRGLQESWLLSRSGVIMSDPPPMCSLLASSEVLGGGSFLLDLLDLFIPSKRRV
jgi:hypothetical protein